MKIIAGLFLCAVYFGAQSFGQSTTNSIIGSWDFDSGDLRATVGQPLQFRGDTASGSSFESSRIGDQAAGVLRLPQINPAQGLLMLHGGGTNLTNYTVLMDVMWPAESDETWRAILQSDTNNLEDAILFVNPENALGINNVYEGSLPANTWHRVAFSFDTAKGELVKYINGALISTQVIGDSVRFNLGSSALLFSDDTDETAPVLINSIQFRAAVMPPEEIAQLGGATAIGFSGSVVPEGEVTIEKIEKIGAEVVLTVSGGGNLQLQRNLSLGSTNWQNVGAPAATNTFRAPATDSKEFFRIERR